MKFKCLCIIFFSVLNLFVCAKIDKKNEITNKLNKSKQNILKIDPIVDTLFKKCFSILNSNLTLINSSKIFRCIVNPHLDSISDKYIYKKIGVADSILVFKTPLTVDEIIYFIT